MKKIIIALTVTIALAGIYFTVRDRGYKVVGRQEQMVAAIFDTGTLGKTAYVLDFALRLIKDSIKFTAVDDETQKRKLTRDTTYFILIKTIVLDKAGHIIKTRTGTDSIKGVWTNIYRHRVLKDFGTFDADLKNYKP